MPCKTNADDRHIFNTKSCFYSIESDKKRVCVCHFMENVHRLQSDGFSFTHIFFVSDFRRSVESLSVGHGGGVRRRSPA